jgi:predicted anti-sigma-YlaC factor YlaD
MSSLNLSVPDCDLIHDLIPDYAFGLTGPDETRLVERHLANCPDAEAQLADFRRLQDDMREDVPQIEPPPQLAERLMAAIAAPQPQPRRIQWAWLAAAAVVALVVTNLYWLLRVNIINIPSDSLSPDNAFILTSTSNLRWARLPASQDTSQASAFLMWNGESKIGLLYVRGFEEMTVSDTYHLWLTKGEDKVSAGTFSVDDKGIGTLLFHITDPIDKYTWARITDEVTGEVVANGELPVN